MPDDVRTIRPDASGHIPHPMRPSPPTVTSRTPALQQRSGTPAPDAPPLRDMTDARHVPCTGLRGISVTSASHKPALVHQRREPATGAPQTRIGRVENQEVLHKAIPDGGDVLTMPG